MTCIVGLVNDGIVYIGGDSLAADRDGCIELRSDPKVFVLPGNFIVGVTGSWRSIDLLRYRFVPPDPGDLRSHHYMATLFVDALRETFKEGGFAEKKDEKETGGTLMVGHRGRLYVIYSDYQVGEPASGYAAMGSGERVALGALQVMKYQEAFASMQPSRMVEAALEAAAFHDAYVRPPFKVLATMEE